MKSLTKYQVVAGALSGLMLFSGHAAAQCCPSGGTVLKTNTGLGEAKPLAQNLSTDSAWKIYRFERDGISYLQINDIEGRVRSAVGRIGDTAWVMPIGTDVDRVSIPLMGISSMPGKVVYRSDDFIVMVVRGGDKGKLSWIIVPLHKP
ncbi:hypothetical protein [Xanthomonas sp. MUS 060]|uniref:hypothetical protein n=1 Tax=Xanthomonas sp. MUS 060 TaxID=1588031 RepID=UPI0009E5D348|nr:hypothetical protein [Xanthomonas sp. MUS 060]